MSTEQLTLQNALSDFKENHTIKYRSRICEGHYSKYDNSCEAGAFDNIVQALLGGYIEVKDGEKIVQCIKPTCVEIYYHEEFANIIPCGKGSNNFDSSEFEKITDEIARSLNSMNDSNKVDESLLVHDFIVYHRNRPFQNKVPLFDKLGILNNHQSGIDIAFEFPSVINERCINVRASALIRGFVRAESSDFSKSKVDDRSTYLYDFLYPYASILGEGITLKWIDTKESYINIQTKERKNVFQYKMDNRWLYEQKKSLDYAIKKESSRNSSNKPIYEPDKRQLCFYNKEFYKNAVPK